jgi:hypothetical protein
MNRTTGYRSEGSIKQVILNWKNPPPSIFTNRYEEENQKTSCRGTQRITREPQMSHQKLMTIVIMYSKSERINCLILKDNERHLRI